jgi:hypothetical protein
MVLSGSELHQLFDVVIHRMNAQHLAGMGSNVDDKIHPANATDDRKTAIVIPRREPLAGVTVALRFNGPSTC